MGTQAQATIFNTAPATNAAIATPSNTTVLSPPSRALYIGAGGNVVVRMAGGTSATFVGVNAGTILPISVDQVQAATTAGSILVLY